jgi:hypothetical protein
MMTRLLSLLSLVALIFAFAILLATSCAQGVRAALTESSAAPRPTETRKSAPVEFSTSRERVGGREIAGFSARHARVAQEPNLTPPAGLKPVEQEAWLAMARRQGASGGSDLASFYPKRYGEAFVVEGEGVRVAVRPVGGTDVAAQIDDSGQVIYRQAYPETDSVHVVSAGRSEEFLFLQNECAPREFEYELSELSAGTRVELLNGEVRFTNETGHGVKIEAPWLIEATGKQPAAAVRWELARSKSGARPGLRLVLAQGLSYPVLIDPSWCTTGSMGTARENHTATLLPSGQVLVAGGDQNGLFLTSAELYDPATGSWAATGSLATRRSSHTATLLPSGQVLVAAGLGTSGHLSSAELYDPASGTWSSTGSLVFPRFAHTATLLLSGKVLVVGGAGTAVRFTELYDPATGSWSITGILAEARDSHTATLLSSGQVLVAGGLSAGELSSAELYDPASGSWSSTDSLATARGLHTATLLSSGQVLVAGGFSNANPFLSSAELYDPASGTWSITGSLGTGRQQHTATLLLSGGVLVAGGSSSSVDDLSSAELYDPATGSWSSSSSLGTGRSHHTATPLPSGNVLVTGGEGAGGILNSAELYDPATVSQITPAGTSCSQFSTGNAENLPIVQYDLNSGLISRLNPLNFLYWVPVTAPAGNNIVTITQTITTGNFSTFFASNGNGTNVFDSDCVLQQRQITQSGNTVTVRFNAPSAGTYFIAIKFNSQSFIREPAPSPTTVHYEFTATGVPHSTSGLDLVQH